MPCNYSFVLSLLLENLFLENNLLFTIFQYSRSLSMAFSSKAPF